MNRLTHRLRHDGLRATTFRVALLVFVGLVAVACTSAGDSLGAKSTVTSNSTTSAIATTSPHESSTTQRGQTPGIGLGSEAVPQLPSIPEATDVDTATAASDLLANLVPAPSAKPILPVEFATTSKIRVATTPKSPITSISMLVRSTAGTDSFLVTQEPQSAQFKTGVDLAAFAKNLGSGNATYSQTASGVDIVTLTDGTRRSALLLYRGTFVSLQFGASAELASSFKKITDSFAAQLVAQLGK